MKKLIIIVSVLFVSAISFGQAKPEMKSTPAPLSAVSLNDSTAFITAKQLNQFLTLLNKIPHETFITLTPQQVISELFAWAKKEWEAVQPKQK